jgi:alkylated DNA repair dioxygenase AlkB
MQQYVINENDKEKSIILYIPNILNKKMYANIKSELENITDWKVGKTYEGKKINRKQKWYQINNQPFCKNWSKQYDRWKSNKYTNNLLEFQNHIQLKINQILSDYNSKNIQYPIYDSLLINYYENGLDHITPHQDNKQSFGNYPTISVISIGETRKFILERTIKDLLKRNKNEKNLNKEFILEDNSLLIMAGSVQRYFCHYIPKEENKINCRYSLTFRQYLN